MNNLNTEEIFDYVQVKILSNILFVDTFQEREGKQTIVIPDDTQRNIKGFTITNDRMLPEYQKKIDILNELVKGEDFTVNEKTFIVYFVFFLFLFPESLITQGILFCLKEGAPNQIRYLQIIFEECVEKLEIQENTEIQKILSTPFFQLDKHRFKTLETNFTTVGVGGGGKESLQLMILIMLSILFSVSYCALHVPIRLPSIVIKTIEDTHVLTNQLKNIPSKEPYFFDKITKSVKKYLKTAKAEKFSKNEILPFISNTLDFIKLMNIFQSNHVFSLIMDSKKVATSITEIITNTYDSTMKNNIVLLGSISKLFLYASASLNSNIVLLLESTSAFGSFTNTLASLALLNEIHKDAIKTYRTFTPEEQKEFVQNISMFGGKKNILKKKHFTKSKKNKKSKPKTQKKKKQKKTKKILFPFSPNFQKK